MRGIWRVLSTTLAAALLAGALLGAGLLAAALALPAAAGAASLPPYVQPYGAGGVSGFYNVLPPGEAGTENVSQLLQYESDGTIPPYFEDQQPLYENLLYAAPSLTNAEIPEYFKDASFGTPTQDITRVEQPASGVTIVRDQYDVPHIYGETQADVEFGAGYAAAEDRLFLMDVLRHAAEADLASFAGGSAGNRAMDEAQWTVAPYTTADLQSQLNALPRLYGKAGRQLLSDLKAYVAGINAYIEKALADPSLMPAEYLGIGQRPTLWKPTDVVALASLIGAIFGKGGGNEVESALTLEAFERRFGTATGRRDWSDFREANDPEAPTTVSKPFPYETDSAFARRGLALPDPGSVRFISPGKTNPDTAEAPRETAQSSTASSGILGYTDTPDPIAIPNDGSLGSALLEDLYGQEPLASNWELVSARHSVTGHAIAVMGPQVGYYFPQILMEEDLHGPGIDARGAAFPGLNLFVELGHGTDYAWSATTATSDNVDTFAEVLCNPRGGRVSPGSTHYLYRGRCRRMQKLVRSEHWQPNLEVKTGPGSAKLVIYRTVHGPVFARGKVGGRLVAFASDRTTYFHEIDSAIGFGQLNDPNYVTGPRSFQRAASHIAFGFNWAYVNARHIAYFESGWYPQRARGTSPDFPILGTGAYDWRGFNPRRHTETDIPFSAHPQAIDPAYLVSWNNKQAPRWAAADDNYGYGPVYRMQLIRAHITADLRKGHGKMDAAQLVQAMELAATEDIREVVLWPILRQVLGHPSNPRLRQAIAQLNAWYRAGGHRWDLAKTGIYANNRAIETMDAWWPRLVAAEFEPTLGRTVFAAVRRMLPLGSVYTGTQPNEPDFAQGWYGQVDKDLRDLLARHDPRTHRRPRGAYSRIYCGHGSFSACRRALRRSLLAALRVSPKSMYGHGYCRNDPQPSCYDEDSWTSLSAIGIQPFPFQNRPTFQQVAEPARVLPR